MQQPAVIHSTFVIERSFSVTPERVFAAFSDPAKKRRWIAENRGVTVEDFQMDFRPGGRETARYRFLGEPFPGKAFSNATVYQDIVPNRLIVIAYTMALEGRVFSSSQATFELLASDTGTDLVFTEQGAYFEGADGPKMREDGWRLLIGKLAKEVES